jgi:CDP-diacylglycerol---glycerol-3-phosphate 3-phosphatidyltransferase
MDIGLYNWKYPVRKMIAGLLPQLADVDPNHISWLMLPVGALIAATYWVGAQGQPWMYLMAIVLIFFRMFLGTLDGLVATHYGKGSKTGEIVNRLAPELCDALYLVALATARHEWMLPGVLAIATSWLITFTGLVGATAGLPTQSVGPAGQTDRLAILQALSLLAFLAEARKWSVDFLGIFLWWVVIGGVLTIVLRLQRNLEAAAQAP